MQKDHRFRNLTIITIAAYFCGQSFFIVFKMWSSLGFYDKVNAMETVILTTVVLCGALELLYFYKFDDLQCSMFTGELFGTKRRIGLKYGELAQIRGKEMMRINADRKRLKNGGKFNEKRWENSVKTTGKNCFEDLDENSGKSVRGWVVNSGKTRKVNIHNEYLDENRGEIVGKMWLNVQRNTNTFNLIENCQKFSEETSLRNHENSTAKNTYHDDNLDKNSYKFVEESWGHAKTHRIDIYDNLERFQVKDRPTKFRDFPAYMNKTHITNRFGIEDDIPRGSLESPYMSSINSEISDSFRTCEDDFYEKILDEEGFESDKRLDKQFFLNKSFEIIEGMQRNNFKQVKFGMISFQCLCVSLLVVPMFSFLGYLAGFIQFEDLHLPFLVYIPFTRSSSPGSIVQYIVVMCAQILYVYLFYLLSSDGFIAAILTNTTLKTEIKLFLNSLNEFDAIFCMKNSSRMDDSLMRRLRNLKFCEKFRRIVAHHQVIYRKLSAYKELIEINAVYIHSAICLELCISLFLLQGELFFKVKSTVASLCLGLVLAQYSQEGQDLEDGFEEMGEALYRISWHNMPVNLRKPFVILLARHSLPPKVSGSYGIFVINRKNLSIIMRASYSYLNLLNRFK